MKKLVNVILLLAITTCFLLGCQSNEEKDKEEISGENIGIIESGNQSGDNEQIENEVQETQRLDFDISFLKMENQKENKVYSPLSIKYALKMLEKGTTGNAKDQITKLVGGMALSKYNSNDNMSLANAMFIRDTFRESVKESYINTLKSKYSAEVIFDSFETADTVNSWVSEKTLELIPQLLDEIDEEENFLLVNALGINMEWENIFLAFPWGVSYAHENFYLNGVAQVSEKEFGENKQVVSGMKVEAALNNYDIINDLGEDYIRQIVSEEYRKWAKELVIDDDGYSGKLSDETIEKNLNEFLDGDGVYRGYMAELGDNYGNVYYSTDFSLYVDEDIKVFAKDLKEYDGTTLQYIGIMPINEELDTYISNVTSGDILNAIDNLKSLELENFNDGVVTKITGYIPKFNMEYELKLKDDLQKLGVTDVFEEGKANLKELSDAENVYIKEALHKANIEFTQDGIKAAAATIIGGMGAGSPFDYEFDVPVEEIDITFDKPYLFLIRDKKTGETWFVGTVYDPLLWEEEPERLNDIYNSMLP